MTLAQPQKVWHDQGKKQGFKSLIMLEDPMHLQSNQVQQLHLKKKRKEKNYFLRFQYLCYKLSTLSP